MVEMVYNIGDYVEYTREYYNGGSHRYEYCTHYGCIIDVNDNKSCNVIKQYGGQIWFGVEPYSKVSEETFLSKFSLYDEYKYKLLEVKDQLPEKIRKIIENKCEEDILRTKRRVINYTLANYLNNKKISTESWAIEWYVYNVLRRYEPFYITKTLTYCYGATKEIQKFMEENISFMIDMQFLRNEYSDLMIYLIEEKLLNFKHKEGKISDKEYSKKIFPLIKIKLESYLKFRSAIPEIDINLQIDFERKKYNLCIPIDELLDTKIIFPSRYGKSKAQGSKCSKKKEFKDLLQYVTTNTVIEPCKTTYTYNKKTKELINTQNNTKIKINHDPEHSVLHSKNNFIIFEDTYSGDMYGVKIFTLFNINDGKMIGVFEVHYNDFDCIYLKFN
jgi:hypothetical protein